MGRKFVDYIGGRDHILSSAADLTRILICLPNGMPYWGSGAINMPGAEMPPGFDFVTHDWTLELWWRCTTLTATSQMGVGIPIAWVNAPAYQIWDFNSSTPSLTWTQRTTASGVYRSCASPSISSGIDYLCHIVVPAGGTPTFYTNNVPGATGVAPSGTPRVMDASYRFCIRTGITTQGISAPALYPFAMNAAMRSKHYSTMISA